MNNQPFDIIEFDTDAAELTLEEMRSVFQITWQSSDTLDQKALLLVAASVIVLSLATFVQASYDMDKSNLYWGIITLAILSYITSVGFALWAIRPRVHKFPVPTDIDLLQNQILLSNKEEATYQIIQSYAKQTANNLNIVDCKSSLIQLSALFLVISTLFFFASVFFRL